LVIALPDPTDLDRQFWYDFQVMKILAKISAPVAQIALSATHRMAALKWRSKPVASLKKSPVAF
jgi:hypothetical protein